MIKVLIVEDMISLRESLANVINRQKDMTVIGAVSRADDALGLCLSEKLSPDLVIIGAATENNPKEIKKKNPGGIAAAEEIQRKLPGIKLVIMASCPEISLIDAARKAGAQSFICIRDASDSEYSLYAIRRAMTGRGLYPGP